jgi:hypothetical protein
LLKLSGHNNTIVDLQVTLNGLYCVSCATGDRFVCIWSLDVANPTEQALQVLVCDRFIRQLSIKIPQNDTTQQKKSNNDSHFEVCGTSFDGIEINVWNCVISTKKKKSKEPIRPISTITLTTPSNQLQLLHTAFSSTKEDQMIVLSGLRANPKVDFVKLKDSNGGFVSTIKLDSLSLLPSLSLTRQKSKKEEENLVKPKYESGLGYVPKKGEDSVQKVQIAAEKAHIEAKSKAEGSVSVIDTRTFLDKLNALEHHVNRVTPQFDTRSTPKADSLQVAIEQAVHSDDPALLETCLQVTRDPIVRATCQRIATPYVVPFLNCLIKRFESNSNRVAKLIPWIRGILLFHGAYLMTIRDIGLFLFILFVFYLYFFLKNFFFFFVKIFFLSNFIFEMELFF